ncbi:MAG TPA: SusC/RagA family TonB-linked outer membrane protein [Prolixibacteraceae bacterium]|nr:SusC/RagA family TonB-linked outer membrane protein [Prolixibacteraceae bacterium]
MKPTLRSLILAPVVFLSMNLQAQEVILSDTLLVDTLQSYSKIEPALSYSKDKEKPVSSAKIDLSQVKFTNELSVLEFLQGRISGLDISNVATDPGVSAQAVLRGQNYTGNRMPLIVIDGIPQQSLGNIFNSYLNGYEKIQHLIPVPLADIQSIEVLKDGTSTALYGADGANGVILIETKKGSRQKLSLTYEFNQSFVEAPSSMPMLSGDEYIAYQLEAWHNSNGAANIPREYAYDKEYAHYYNFSANTDWMKAVTQPGHAGNHFLSFSGGNQKNRLYGSVNYHDELGTTINSGSKSLFNRLNFEHYFTKKLTLTLNLSYGYSKDDGIREDILNMAFKKAPNHSIWKHDAVGVTHGTYFVPPSTNEGNYWNSLNPVAVSENSSAVKKANDLMTTAHLQYRFFDWLQFRETFSYNTVSSAVEVEEPYATRDRGYEQFRNELQAFVKAPFENERIHSLSGTFSWVKQDETISNGVTTNYNKNDHDANVESYDRNRNAVVSSVIYKLFDRYIIMGNARLESNSLIYDNERWDKFYGASLAWRFSDEPFFTDLKLNHGQIHLGWSEMDYQADPGFLAYEAYTDRTPYTDPIFGGGSSNPYLGTSYIIHTPTYEAGIELGMFKNRLHISADYYYKEPEFITSTTRSTSTLKLENKGWEGAFDYAVVRRKNLSWSLQFNIAHNNQMLVKATNQNKIKPDIYTREDYGTFIGEGYSFGSIYGYVREGVYASDADAVARDSDGNVYYVNDEPLRMKYSNYGTFTGGDTKYRDINFDGVINEDDRVYLGNSIPDFTGGFGSTLRFRGLSLTCNFHYRTGYEMINHTAYEAEGKNSKNNMSRTMLNRWRVQGQQGQDLMPKAYVSRYSNYLPSDRYVESGSFARLNYLNLGYSFGSKVCQKLHVKDLSLNLSGQRIYTLTKYSGLNVETEISNNNLRVLNKDNSRISPPEVYTASIRIVL